MEAIESIFIRTTFHFKLEKHHQAPVMCIPSGEKTRYITNLSHVFQWVYSWYVLIESGVETCCYPTYRSRHTDPALKDN